MTPAPTPTASPGKAPAPTPPAETLPPAVTPAVSGPARRGRLGLLAVREFRLLWIGETTSSFGSSISSVALPLVALTLHASVFAISALTAAAWLPWLVIGLPAGAWVDRLARRWVMMAADLVSLAAFASIPVAAALGCLTVAQLLVVALLGGSAKVFFATAYKAFMPALLPAGDLLEGGNAKLQGSEQVSQVVGPGAAGLIAQAATAVGGGPGGRPEFRHGRTGSGPDLPGRRTGRSRRAPGGGPDRLRPGRAARRAGRQPHRGPGHAVGHARVAGRQFVGAAPRPAPDVARPPGARSGWRSAGGGAPR